MKDKAHVGLLEQCKEHYATEHLLKKGIKLPDENLFWALVQHLQERPVPKQRGGSRVDERS